MSSATHRPGAGPDPRSDLNRGILVTEIGPRLARAMTGLFLAAIGVVPLAQAATELLCGHTIQALDVFTRTPTKDNLRQYEKDLEHTSVVKQAVQPRLQLALSACVGFGNTNAVIGNDGWLFYRPGVDLLTGPPLLDRARLALRKAELADAGEVTPCPDPRPSILAFNEACRKAGARLVLLPVPDKAMLQPAQLTSRLNFSRPIRVPANPDYPRLLGELRAAGVDVFDPTPARLGPDDPPRFLRQDSHWTPDWMESVARALAEHIEAVAELPRVAPKPLRVREGRVRRVGDLVDMLQLPAGQTLFLPQEVTIHQVSDPCTGGCWRPTAGADVLLLGDSFSNIYSIPEMGLGTAAGFPAQLSRYLGRDLDVIARNGSGATATRRELARRADPLTGKRVVVWEFAARELAAANWEVVPFPPPAQSGPTAPSVSPESGPLVADCTLIAVSRVPAPYSGPYKDCLSYVKCRVDRVVEGSYRDTELIAVLWCMRDNVLLPAARYAPGKHLLLRMVPLRQAPGLGDARRVDDLEDYSHRPYYVLEGKEL